MTDETPADLALLELYAQLDDAEWKAQSARPSTSQDLSNPQVLALGLFVATFEVYLGIRALLRERLAEEARMLSRTLLDDTTRLIWLAKAADSDELDARLLRYIFDSIDHEQRFMEMARDADQEWADEELTQLATELEDVKKEADSRGIKLKKLPDARGMLKLLGQEELYLWHVRASQSVHSSRVGFSARFRPGSDETAPITIPLESSTFDVVQVGVMAMQAFSLAMVAAADLLGWDSPDELVDYRKKVVRLSGGLYDRVKKASKARPADESG